MRLLSILLIVLVLVAACDATASPTLPPITVVITAVDDTEALGNAVAQALTETAQVNMRATETVLAQGGITLTPSLTPTLMPTLPPRPTRESSPTATFTPSVTPTPTFAPYLTNTPASVPAETAAWVRVIHVWRGTELAPNSPFDVSINGETISRGLTFGQQTNFQQVTPGAVEIILRETVTVDGPPVPPRFSEVMQVAPGENLSLVIAKSGLDVMLIPVREDAAALADGTSRLTLVQANPQLFPALVVMPDLRRLLASALQTGQIIGPIDVPSGSNYVIDLYDASNPEALLASLPLLSLENRVSYLAILVPAAAEDEFTNVYVFAGSTRLLADEVYARFINVATNTGALKVTLNEQTQFERLTTGVSDVIPLSVQGVRMNLTNEAGQMVNSLVLGPWAAEGERTSDKIVVLYDNPAETRIPVGAIAYSMNAPRSAINANVRLVHVLPGVIPLDLQVRARVIQPAAIGTTATPTPLPEEANPWVKIAEAEYLAVSGYAARVPQTYDVRVVLSGTRNVLAELSLVSLRPGASYDFVVLPGTEANSAQLVLLQPRAQMAAEQGSPSAIAEAVAATLTAVAPISTATPTRASSPTPTRTPLPTNTPRPSNTPSFLPPSLAVEPAPPDAARGSLVLTGQGFLPNRVYSIYFDNALEPTQTGVTTEDGSVLVVVNLPDLSPGLHTLRLCSGTCPGSGIEAVAVVRIALPNQTPTATPQP